ncbi:MAG: dockerin type I domain-containing protein [Bacteroidota bacterium]
MMKYFLSFAFFLTALVTTQAQTVIDFTDPSTPVFGTDIRVVVNGVALLPSGDVDSDGDVDMDDYTAWQPLNSEVTDYSTNGAADLNLDGVINAIDVTYFLFPNLGLVSQIP